MVAESTRQQRIKTEQPEHQGQAGLMSRLLGFYS